MLLLQQQVQLCPTLAAEGYFWANPAKASSRPSLAAADQQILLFWNPAVSDVVQWYTGVLHNAYWAFYWPFGKRLKAMAFWPYGKQNSSINVNKTMLGHTVYRS
jgi:hypothetical protein